jgi:hypothetical protein
MHGTTRALALCHALRVRWPCVPRALQALRAMPEALRATMPEALRAHLAHGELQRAVEAALQGSLEKFDSIPLSKDAQRCSMHSMRARALPRSLVLQLHIGFAIARDL